MSRGKKRSRQNRRASRGASWVQLGAIAVAFIVATALAWTAFNVSAAGVAEPREPGPIPTFGSANTITPKRQPVEVMARLEDPTKPFTISVLGDSTGAVADNWVLQTAAWLSETYDRPVEFHQWAVESAPPTYLPEWDTSDGANAPIVVWNGSASGMPVSYTMDNYDALVQVDPAGVDLVFVNHGHNQSAGTLVRDATPLVDKILTTMPNAALVVIGQNAEGPDAPNYIGHEANVTSWLAEAKRREIATVDVHSPFVEYGPYTELLDEVGVHPTADGFTIWTSQVVALLSATE